MAGTDPSFTDTNLLLNSVDASQPVKQRQALSWLTFIWESGTGRISWQVLHEFSVNAIRKLQRPSMETRRTVRDFVAWRPVDTSLALIERAWHWNDTAHVTYWDGLIVAAAERAECRWLLSEDFQHGQRFGEVTVVNPFRGGPDHLPVSRPLRPHSAH